MKHEISRVVFDPFQPKVDDIAFMLGTTECKDFYGYIEEEIPPGIPEPLDKSAHTMYFFYANHCDNVVTRRWHRGVFLCNEFANYLVLKEA